MSDSEPDAHERERLLPDAPPRTYAPGSAAAISNAAAASSSAATPAAPYSMYASASSPSSCSPSLASSSAPLLSLSIVRPHRQPVSVQVPASWTLAQLRDFAMDRAARMDAEAQDGAGSVHQPPAPAVASASASAPAASVAASSVSSMAAVPSSSAVPSAPPAPSAASSSPSVVILYHGRKLPPSALGLTLASLRFTSGSSVHMLPVEERRGVGGSARAAVAAEPGQSYPGGFQADAAAEDGPAREVMADRDRARDDDYAIGAWDGEYVGERRGSGVELLLGVMLGMMLGLFAFIWLLQPAVSRRLRLGICVGVALHLSLGLSRTMLGHPQTGPRGAPPMYPMPRDEDGLFGDPERARAEQEMRERGGAQFVGGPKEYRE